MYFSKSMPEFVRSIDPADPAEDREPGDPPTADARPPQGGVAALVWAVITRSTRIDPIVEPPRGMDNELIARRLRLPIVTRTNPGLLPQRLRPTGARAALPAQSDSDPPAPARKTRRRSVDRDPKPATGDNDPAVVLSRTRRKAPRPPKVG